MTVLTQLSVGAFATIWLLQLLGASARLGVAALGSLMVGGLALSRVDAAPRRPVHAYRALRMWRRSWLSREVLLFIGFSAVAGAYAAAALVRPARAAQRRRRASPSALGIAGVTASACIYRVPSRPAWNTRYTLLQFNLTAGVLGPLFAAAVGAGDARLARARRRRRWPARSSCCWRCASSAASPPTASSCKGTARLLSTVLAGRLLLRGVLLAVGAVALPLIVVGAACWLGAAVPAVRGARWPALALAGEILGRYLFFVSVVPKHLAAPYIAVGKRGRMTLKRLLGLDTRADRVRLRRRSGRRLHLGAEGAGQLGGDDVRVLLGRLRHVHRRQGRPRGQRARQSGSSGQPRHALPEGAVRASHHRRRQPRPLSAAAHGTASSRRVSWDEALDDDGDAVPRGAGTLRAGVGRRDQHRPARHRGVLHARQARAARHRHAATTTATRRCACPPPWPATSAPSAATARPGAYEDLERADVILLIGANIAENHPILCWRLQVQSRTTRSSSSIRASPRRR